MEKILEGTFIGPELGEDGVVNCGVFLSNMTEDIDDVLKEWLTSEYEVGIYCPFKLSDILDFAIESNELWRYGGCIDEKAKPLFQATRNELQAMIQRIDAMEYYKV